MSVRGSRYAKISMCCKINLFVHFLGIFEADAYFWMAIYNDDKEQYAHLQSDSDVFPPIRTTCNIEGADGYRPF